jgi:hypothetical protein
VTSGVTIASNTTSEDGRRAASIGRHGSSSMPTGVALTSRSTPSTTGAPTSTSVDGLAARTVAATRSQRVASRSKSRIDAGRSAANAAAIAVPAPPRPTSITRAPRTFTPARRSPSTQPSPSKISPCQRPSAPRASALIAPTARACAPRLAASAQARCLNGMVNTSPSRFATRISAGSTASNSASRTWIGTSTASRPRRRSAQVTISGERTCAIGSPTMPKRRVLPLTKSTWSVDAAAMIVCSPSEGRHRSASAPTGRASRCVR